ncbi:MAG TPA: SDR family oxidoreductase [Holophagaceae bacterium]|nr:SDR family oxidoreductase [Holophagaceae bacterium]
MIHWQGARVLITGASSGLGERFAHAVAERGAVPILVARRQTRLAEVAQAIHERTGIHPEVIACDLLIPQARAELVTRVGAVDVIIPNAGWGPVGRAGNLSLRAHQEMITLNIEAVVEVVHGLLPLLRRRRQGGILFVASTAAFQPCPNFATYGATKAFILSWSQALGEELRKEGLTVTTLCPGATATEFFQAANIPHRQIPALATGLLDPVAVVEAGLRGLERGRAVVIPGLRHRALVAVQRFVPRRVIAWVAGRSLGLR